MEPAKIQQNSSPTQPNIYTHIRIHIQRERELLERLRERIDENEEFESSTSATKAVEKLVTFQERKKWRRKNDGDCGGPVTVQLRPNK